MSGDIVIKGRTLEHFITFFLCLIITVVLGYFALKYTNWFCDCNPSPDEICPSAGYIKATEVIDEIEKVEPEKIIEGSVDIFDDLGIDLEEETEEKTEEIETIMKEESIGEESDEIFDEIPLDGNVNLIIKDIDFEHKNPQDEEMDYIKLKSVTITLENGKQDFLPRVEGYLYDDEHDEHRNRYPEVYTHNAELEAGERMTFTIPFDALSLEYSDIEQTVVIRVTNAVNNALIVKDEKSFKPK